MQRRCVAFRIASIKTFPCPTSGSFQGASLFLPLISAGLSWQLPYYWEMPAYLLLMSMCRRAIRHPKGCNNFPPKDAPYGSIDSFDGLSILDRISVRTKKGTIRKDLLHPSSKAPSTCRPNKSCMTGRFDEILSVTQCISAKQPQTLAHGIYLPRVRTKYLFRMTNEI
jgi:hypothetical protein